MKLRKLGLSRSAIHSACMKLSGGSFGTREAQSEIEPLGHHEDQECDSIAARLRRLAHDRLEASGWLPERTKRAELVGAQSDRHRGEILLEMRHRGGPGNWQHGGGTLQQPGEPNLGLPARPRRPRRRGFLPPGDDRWAGNGSRMGCDNPRRRPGRCSDQPVLLAGWRRRKPPDEPGP